MDLHAKELLVAAKAIFNAGHAHYNLNVEVYKLFKQVFI